MFWNKNKQKTPYELPYTDININTYIYLFNEMIINSIPNDNDLLLIEEYCKLNNNEKSKYKLKVFNDKIHDLGFTIGNRIVDSTLHKENYVKHIDKIKNFEKLLLLISTKILKKLFNDETSLEKAINKDEYYLLADCFLVNKYSTRNCGEFVAGIIDGFLNGCGYKLIKCAAIITDKNKNAIIIKF